MLPRDSAVGEDGHLELGGCDVVEVAARFGTPAYLVAERDLRDLAREARDALARRHADSRVLFASKAFACTAVLRTFAEEGLGCDVASGGELSLALRAGFPPERILLHGNAKSTAELELAVESGIGHVVLDSWDDISRLAGLGARRGGNAAPLRVLLRVTPDVSGETHRSISTGQADSKFGFSMAEAPAAIARVRDEPALTLDGLHCHIGSQLLELAPFREAARAISALGRFPVVNLGGGLGVGYLTGQAPPSLEAWADAVAGAAHEFLGEDFRLLVEPGRALVANSTITVYEVQTVKRNVSTWVAVDGGMSDNLRPMLYDARYEVLRADDPLAEPTLRAHLAGKHCESGDVIVRDARLPAVAPGALLVTPATGGYGFSMANNYNGVPRAPVVFCRDGEARLVVRRETYEDLAARDVEGSA